MQIPQGLKELILKSPFVNIPVKATGIIAGAWWTIWPFRIYWQGLTEKDVDMAIKKHCFKKGVVFWDVGAHFGVYSVAVAMNSPQSKVFAFEPNQFSYRKLLRHG